MALYSLLYTCTFYFKYYLRTCKHVTAIIIIYVHVFTGCHAISNAIVWANRHDLRGCILYTVTHPCNKCAQLIIQCRMSHVHYMSKQQCNGSETPYAQKLLNEAGISCRSVQSLLLIIISYLWVIHLQGVSTHE